MAISPSSSVPRARAALVQRLREIRLDAGLTARALALAAGWHESKVSRIEHVRTPPSDADIRLWCQICGADDQAADLIASSRATDSMYTEWRRLEVTGLRHLQESLVPLYEQTTRFRAYQSHVVPGLFQTPAYAAALLSAITAFRGIPDEPGWPSTEIQAYAPRCYAFTRHQRLTTLAASAGCWHTRPLGVSAVLKLAPRCSPWRLQAAHGYPGSRHGR